nr:unnamed protein product [Callosobruchus analis]
MSERLNLSRKLFISKWLNGYEGYCRNKPTGCTLIVPKIRNSYWFENFNYSRTTIIRMKFGHACYSAHLYNIRVVNSNQCDICETEEIADLDHIIFNCSKYQPQTAKLRERFNNNSYSSFNMECLNVIATNQNCPILLRKQSFNCGYVESIPAIFSTTNVSSGWS